MFTAAHRAVNSIDAALRASNGSTRPVDLTVCGIYFFGSDPTPPLK